MGVLKGAVVLPGRPHAALDLPCELDFMAVSSYGSLTDSSGVVRILKDLDAPIEGKDVLIVEDIVDSGLTLNYLLRNLRGRNPRSLEVCALLVKPGRRKIDLPIRYVGLRDPRPVRGRLRPRSRPALPQPAVRGGGRRSSLHISGLYWPGREDRAARRITEGWLKQTTSGSVRRRARESLMAHVDALGWAKEPHARLFPQPGFGRLPSARHGPLRWGEGLGQATV